MPKRISNVLGVAVMFLVFLYSYKTIVVPVYGYYGMGWRETPTYMLVMVFAMNLSIAFIATPIYRQPSQVFFAVQFLIVFLPASIVCLNTVLPEMVQPDVLVMIFLMYLGLMIQCIFIRRNTSGTAMMQRGRLDHRMLLLNLGIIAVIVLASASYILQDVISIAGLESMYSQRELIDEQKLGLFFRYGLSWLTMLIFPALFVCSISLKGWGRGALITFCIIGYAILYGLTATKTALFAPVIIIGLYALLRRRRLSYLAVFALFLSALLILPVFLKNFTSLELINSIYVGIFNFRIFSVPHITYVQYLDFFYNNSLTFGSHVTGLSLLITYPFDSEVYLLIGDEYYPGSNLTANAGMWAQDGIAGFGMSGILIVSILFTLIMRVLDRAAEGHDPRRVGAMLAMLTLSITNTSLFTTLLTGGLLIAMFLLHATKRVEHHLPQRPLTQLRVRLQS